MVARVLCGKNALSRLRVEMRSPRRSAVLSDVSSNLCSKSACNLSALFE